MPDNLTALVDGQPVLIEITEEARVTRGFSTETRGAPAEKVVDALDSAKNAVINVAKKMVTAIRTADQSITPDEFELEFNLKFSAEGQAIIAKIGGEASLRVKLTYRHK